MYKLLHEKIISDYIGFKQLVNCILLHGVNRKVIQLVESGLADYYVNRHRFKRMPEDDPCPQVLTLDQMSAGFIIWLASLAITLVCFVLEILLKSCRNLYSKFMVRRLCAAPKTKKPNHKNRNQRKKGPKKLLQTVTSKVDSQENKQRRNRRSRI